MFSPCVVSMMRNLMTDVKQNIKGILSPTSQRQLAQVDRECPWSCRQTAKMVLNHYSIITKQCWHGAAHPCCFSYTRLTSMMGSSSCVSHAKKMGPATRDAWCQ